MICSALDCSRQVEVGLEETEETGGARCARRPPRGVRPPADHRNYGTFPVLFGLWRGPTTRAGHVSFSNTLHRTLEPRHSSTPTLEIQRKYKKIPTPVACSKTRPRALQARRRSPRRSAAAARPQSRRLCAWPRRRASLRTARRGREKDGEEHLSRQTRRRATAASRRARDRCAGACRRAPPRSHGRRLRTRCAPARPGTPTHSILRSSFHRESNSVTIR